MLSDLHERAFEALMIPDPAEKSACVETILAAWKAGDLVARESGPMPARLIPDPGRPPTPQLVPPSGLARRGTGRAGGHAALMHAIAHIEFNAINLALDCVYRFRGLPDPYYDGWLQVAAEEAFHFGLVCGRLAALGHAYGDFPAHNGLWEMAVKTAGDPLLRMALVPRVLEARGLDATPPIIAKLRQVGDADSIAVLDVILRDEIGHVALGDFWFRYFCAQRGLEPEATYLALMAEFDAPWPPPPLNEEARRAAGFSEAEIERLGRGRRQASFKAARNEPPETLLQSEP